MLQLCKKSDYSFGVKMQVTLLLLTLQINGILTKN